MALLPPEQVQLSPNDFPKERWAQILIRLLNKFVVQAVAALTTIRDAQPRYKVLQFKTGAVVADSFPIDAPVELNAVDVRVAQVVAGPQDPSQAITVQWTNVTGGVRITAITGLTTGASYEIRLSIQ